MMTARVIRRMSPSQSLIILLSLLLFQLFTLSCHFITHNYRTHNDPLIRPFPSPSKPPLNTYTTLLLLPPFLLARLSPRV